MAAGLVIIGGVLVSPWITQAHPEGSTISAFDRLMCDWFPETCENISTLTTDELEQLDLLIKACSVQLSERCNNLSWQRYSQQDYQNAAKLYQSRCQQNDANGYTNLGYLYDKGFGVAVDSQKANTLYLQGCRMGLRSSCQKTEQAP